MKVPEISAEEAAAILKSDPSIKLVDVRTDEEYRRGSIKGAILVNDNTTLRKMLAWPKSTPILLYCHKGIDSRKAGSFLRSRSFKNVMTISGGIDAWSQKADPKIPRY